MGVGASRLAAYGYGSSDTYTCKNTYSQYTYGRAPTCTIKHQSVMQCVHTKTGVTVMWSSVSMSNASELGLRSAITL